MKASAAAVTLQFYWDVGSTNSYFAFHLLRPLAAKYGAQIEYVPFNLGYVFRRHGYALTQEPVAKMRNRKRDLMRWARRYQLPFKMPDKFPIKTSRALRGALVMRQHNLEEAYMSHLFGRYWEQNDASIENYAGLAATVSALGLDPDVIAQSAESRAVRELSENLIEQALADGVFGAPTIKIENEIYWGKDRFEFVEDHLAALTQENLA